MIFVPEEMGTNTLRFTYLMAWWHLNCITLHVTTLWLRQCSL